MRRVRVNDANARCLISTQGTLPAEEGREGWKGERMGMRHGLLRRR
jgi:hypothetical protein